MGKVPRVRSSEMYKYTLDDLGLQIKLSKMKEYDSSYETTTGNLIVFYFSIRPRDLRAENRFLKRLMRNLMDSGRAIDVRGLVADTAKGEVQLLIESNE